ncbi:MAG: guanylate kinase [Candidatus Gastranaerophilales bacterium]|nr:guanylate kinase [Candidatus Gastranaerophilales bacterium]
MKNNNAKLIIFTGPSGVGKGTILADFFKLAGNNIVYSISSTTRKPRAGEIDGTHYFFKEKEEFEKLIKENAFLEWANYSGNYYGTNKQFVENNIKEGKSVLLEIELQGAMVVMQKCPEAVSIFIKPPTFEELERRLRGRHSDTEEAILKRLATAKDELRHIDIFDYVIENDKVENAVAKLIEIYRKETE